ncbi:cyclic GMP-AMP synthase [Ixodes scapularis]|uniref:cyclic GMP-AMP synthase n=1 Tax=Ixodes scapularis TaxID=6945 RepID=UPI001C38EB52|nr:cyclic GMP-AMP synthase [Ixodes scapularis]
MASFLYFDEAERKLNAKLLTELDKVHKSITLDDDDTASNVAILETLLDDITKQMAWIDPLFREVFNRLVYTGSYYEGLRTKSADEFDINLVLDLPFQKCDVSVVGGPADYVGYKVSPAAIHRLRREGGEQLHAWMDSENRLLPDKVKSWLQSVFDRALRSFNPSRSSSLVAQIRPSQSGPAKTFHIILKDGCNIDVDLVPVIEFKHPDWPEGTQRKHWMTRIPKTDCNWFLIPKPPRSNSYLWRLHFPNMEKRLIEDFGCVKPIIRLLKTTRDSYKWNLSSYALKTFVMHEVLIYDDKYYWHPGNQGMLFVKNISAVLCICRPSLDAATDPLRNDCAEEG